MQAVQMSFPHQIPLGNSHAGTWRPVPFRGAARVRPTMGQDVVAQSARKVGEGARIASAMMVGIAAGVSGALLAFSGTEERPRPVLQSIGWGVLALGVLAVGVNFFRVVGGEPAPDTAAAP